MLRWTALVVFCFYCFYFIFCPRHRTTHYCSWDTKPKKGCLAFCNLGQPMANVDTCSLPPCGMVKKSSPQRRPCKPLQAKCFGIILYASLLLLEGCTRALSLHTKCSMRPSPKERTGTAHVRCPVRMNAQLNQILLCCGVMISFLPEAGSHS